MGHGRITEQGTYDELAEAGGLFATRDLALRGVYSISTTWSDNGRPNPISNRLLLAAVTPTRK